MPPEAIDAKEVESGTLPDDGEADTETDRGVVVVVDEAILVELDDVVAVVVVKPGPEAQAINPGVSAEPLPNEKLSGNEPPQLSKRPAG